ncbi:MAG: sulfurtransferase [Rhodocyclaceae bacterium]|nr:sulfurtransferase [Rhodocyclaceae bacterium]
MSVAYTTLVPVSELVAHIADPNWRVFDCRHDLGDTGYGERAYAKEHIPGAQFMHLDRDLSGAKNGTNGRHPLPDPQTFAARLAACGVGPQTQVVAYDNEGSAFAARLWWMLRWLGHDKVAVLDGGMAGWRRAKQPLTGEVPRFPPAQFPVNLREEGLVRLPEMLSRLGEPGLVLVDARTEERFSGEEETVDPVAGHVPGSVNRFYYDNLDDAGCYFLPPEELREVYAGLLAGHPASHLIHTCGSGVTACQNQLAMEVAGLTGSRLYAGSWSEWCSDPARPVELGM